MRRRWARRSFAVFALTLAAAPFARAQSGASAPSLAPTSSPPTPTPTATATPTPTSTSTATATAPLSPSPDGLPPLPPLPSTEASPLADAQWKLRYEDAHSHLIAGDFSAASALFADLADKATNPTDRALALEQKKLADEWLRHGYVIVHQSDIGEAAPAPPPAPPKPPKDLRTSDELVFLYLTAGVYGLGSGVWLDTATQANSDTSVLPALAVSGAAVGGVALLDSGRHLRYGVPQSMVSGVYIGLEEGIIWTMWNNEKEGAASWKPSTFTTVIWGFSTVGLITGGALGASIGTTPGRASFVGSTAVWSAALSGFLSGALNPDESTRKNSAWLAAGIGLNAGAVLGLVAAGSVSPSIARVRFLDLGGVAGGILGAGTYYALADRDPSGSAAAGSAALGIGLGLAATWIFTRKMPQDPLRPHRADEPQASSSPPFFATLHPTIIPSPGGAMVGAQGQLF